MVLKMQELLLSRGLKPGDVMLIFLEFDTSGDGALDLAEFRTALDVMGVKLPGDKLRHVFEFFDADGDMQLDACEFCQAPVPLQCTMHCAMHCAVQCTM